MRFSALVRFSTRTSSHAIKRYNVTVTIDFLLDYGFALMQCKHLFSCHKKQKTV